jgi:dihydrodipicolinate synthase/N-acetylneuraminate lyase
MTVAANNGLGGILPVLQTPFDAAGEVDHAALAGLVRFATTSGCSGVVYPANASEFYTLSDDERLAATATVIAAAAGAIPVVACVSAVSERQAAVFARHAGEHGAAAVMALPPTRASVAGIVDYFRRGVAASGLPIVLQNVGAPFGTPLDERGLDGLLESVPEVLYVKEELPPTTHRISRLVERYGDRLHGVIGGANGQWLVQEARRGAVGCMPAAALVDLQVPIQKAIDEGDWQGARCLQLRLQPLLSYVSIYGVSIVKEILQLRGVLPAARTRDPGAVALDDADRSELRRFLASLGLIDASHVDSQDGMRGE